MVEKLADAYLAGASTNDLSVEHGIHRNTIYGILKRGGVTFRQRGMDEKSAALARELYESGLSLVQVAERLSWSANTVHRELNRLGVAMRDPRGGRRKADAQGEQGTRIDPFRQSKRS
jgi:transposase